MRMKLSMLLVTMSACLLWGMAAISAAADQGQTRQATGEARAPGQVLEKLRAAMDDLNLSADQKQKVEQIFRDAMTDARGNREKNQSGSPQDRAAQFRTRMAEIRDKVEAVLTPDQKVKLEEKLTALRKERNDNGPTSQPAGARPGMMLESFRQAVKELDLNGDQKTKVEAVLKQAGEKLQAMRSEFQAGKSEGMRDKLQEIMQTARTDIAEILTPDQKDKLRTLMQEKMESRNGDTLQPKADAPATGNKPGTAPAKEIKPETPRAKPADSPQGSANRPAEKHASAAGQPAGGQAVPGVTAALGSQAGPSPGQPAPDFKLHKLDGSNVQLSAFKGRVLVVTFGSFTSPAFRDRASGMEALRKEAGSAVDFLIVYTREAHPQGGWEIDRNKDEKIVLPDPADEKSRLAAAKMAKEKLGLNTVWAVDSMDDAVAKAYGGLPNGTVVLGRDGRIVARQTWTDPSGLRRLIDQAIAGRATE